MDDNVEGSLLFGAVVGGLFALAQGAAEKQKLTHGQLQDINRFSEAFTQLQKIVEDKSIVAIYNIFNGSKTETNRSEILKEIDDHLQTNESYIGIIDNFSTTLNQVMSPRFTAERANPKTHEIQAQLSALTELPTRIEALLQKRIALLRLIRNSMDYIVIGKTKELKPEDAAALKNLVQELKALETRITSMLTNSRLLKQ